MGKLLFCKKNAPFRRNGLGGDVRDRGKDGGDDGAVGSGAFLVEFEEGAGLHGPVQCGLERGRVEVRGLSGGAEVQGLDLGELEQAAQERDEPEGSEALEPAERALALELLQLAARVGDVDERDHVVAHRLRGGMAHGGIFLGRDSVQVKLDYSRADVRVWPDADNHPLINPPRRSVEKQDINLREILGGGKGGQVAGIEEMTVRPGELKIRLKE